MSRLVLLAMLVAANLLSFGFGLSRPARADLLPVPPNLVALDSEAGEKMLFEADAAKAYFPLSLQFVTQQNQAFCGVASLVMVLNALHMPAPVSGQLAPFSAFDQSNIFNAATEKVVPRATIEEEGMTLDQIGALAQALGLKAEVHHAADSTVDDFRKRASESLRSDGRYVVVNYLRSAIGQMKYGHISPLAAYDAKSDRFLILDVSRYKYPPVWVKTSELFAAMNTPDPSNDDRSRGFVEISR